MTDALSGQHVIETDALVIGAGPAGLFQVFQLGLLEISAHVVDSLPSAGGQCIELYPDKPIYDIPALAVCTGRELVDRLTQQIEPFGASFHLNQVVTHVAPGEDGRFHVETSAGKRFIAKTIFIAAGVGAFQPRRLKVDGLDAFEGSHLFYSVGDAARFDGTDLVMVGDDDAALEWALKLCPGRGDGHPHKARQLTLVHRRDAFRAAPAVVQQMREAVAQGAMDFVVGQITGVDAADGKITALQVTNPDGAMQALDADKLLVFSGLSPKLGPIADWGLDLERRQLRVDTETFATSAPGIFAVGDINTYPGKKKLIVCGFHECVLAAFAAAALVFPDRKVMLQYTTTSPKLHKLLGVETPQNLAL
jgi:thioredoxin reductase (NADPH)